ncbi:MAG: hypothetical protein GVY13_17825 [Alphaproteobacteria bacterium]|jgi:hypothetical protein|nr:hypothetical protein [Alphaproteobacteria bacterium]
MAEISMYRLPDAIYFFSSAVAKEVVKTSTSSLYDFLAVFFFDEKPKKNLMELNVVTRIQFLLHRGIERLLFVVREDMTLNDESKNVYIASLNQLTKFCSPLHLNHQMQSLSFSGENKVSLMGLRDILNNKVQVIQISDDQKVEIQEKIDEMRTLVNRLQIDEFVKEYIIDELRYLQIVLKKFSLLGGWGLEESFVNLHLIYLKNRNKKESSIFQCLFSVLVLLSIIIDQYANLESALEYGQERVHQMIEYFSNEEHLGGGNEKLFEEK